MRKRGHEDVTEMSGWLYADLLLGLAVVFLVAVPFLGISDTEVTQCPSVVVPDVFEKPIDDAAAEMEKRNLVAKKIPSEKQGVPEDAVYLQDPAAGKSVCEGTEIRLTYNLRVDPAPEVYPETFKVVLKTDDAGQLGNRLKQWIMEQGIRKDSFVNVALVYGYYSPRRNATQGAHAAKSAFSKVVAGCQSVDACKNLEPLGSERTETREARFFGTLGEPREGWVVRSGEFFVEMFVVCPDKCKG
ncbi:MAG: PASTA domain-containing protein [Betaproteobacteria bacterium]|nr:PASTA domain-containing protein [Betaproteobacteria bacterium]